MNHNAVCRTAPATPGLIKIMFDILIDGTYMLIFCKDLKDSMAPHFCIGSKFCLKSYSYHYINNLNFVLKGLANFFENLPHKKIPNTLVNVFLNNQHMHTRSVIFFFKL